MNIENVNISELLSSMLLMWIVSPLNKVMTCVKKIKLTRIILSLEGSTTHMDSMKEVELVSYTNQFEFTTLTPSDILHGVLPKFSEIYYVGVLY